MNRRWLHPAVVRNQSEMLTVPSADIVRMAMNFVSYSARNCAVIWSVGVERTSSESGDRWLGAVPLAVW